MKIRLLTLFLLIPSLAHADDSKAADTLFREGRSAAEAGHYAIACAKFEESYRLDPAPGTLLNLGDCEENQGHLTRALEHFHRLNDELPPGDDRKRIADARARAIELREPKLRIVPIVVTPTPAPSPTPTSVVHDNPPAVVLAPALAPIPTSTGASTQRVATFVVGGVGLAFVSSGAILGAVALSRLGSANAACQGNVCANAEAVSQFRGAQSFAIAADIVLVAGVVLVATAIVIAVSPRASRTPAWVGGRF